jgi:outer membrane protein assembly factor BamB
MSLSRRRLLAGVFILSGFFLAVAPGSAADWPQFLGPARNATSAETGLRTSWSAKGPPLLWQKDAGQGFSGPVVVGERLILFHRHGEREIVECLKTANGEGTWKFSYPCAYEDDFGKGDGPRSTPLVADGRVFTLGVEGMLHCLDLKTGEKIWSRPLAKEYHIPRNFFGIGTSPILVDDLLLVNVGGKGAGVVAFDKRTGREAWKATADGASYSSPVLATLHGQRVAVFFTRQGVVLLDPRDGSVRYQKRWRARFDASVNAAAPVVVGDLVFFSASYGTGALLLRLGKDTPEQVWNGDDVLSCHYNTPVIYQDHLYGIDGRQEAGARLRCVELKTGKVRWTREGFGCASMILAQGRLIALTEKGDLVLLDATPDEYRERGRANVLGATPCRAEIALADGRLYARDQRKLACWDLRK